jgi:RNA polymerase sigma factor (sigma-70 family)
MAMATLNGFLQRLKSAMAAETLAPLSDAELLRRFLATHDQSVFATLLSRHGPMVFRVCRRVLPREQDAEDAFQATFLVLARQARTIRKASSLASWLHGVAYRLALEARDSTLRRRRYETRTKNAATSPGVADATTWKELRTLLDEELARLPERLRTPLVLCYMEGLTQDEAARQLSASKSTFRRRLEEGRDLLASRLVRRGVALSAALFTLLLSESVASAGLLVRLTGSTAEAAACIVAGHSATRALVSARVAALTEGMVKTMAITKFRVVSLLLVAGAVGAGAFAAGAYQSLAKEQKSQAPVRSAVAPTAPAGKEDSRLKSVLQDAEQDAAAIEDAFNRTAAFCYIARVHAKMGRRDAAKAILEKALAAEALEQGAVKGQHKDNRLSIIAECQAETGDAKGALETIDTGISAMNQTSALRWVSTALAKTGDSKGAMDAIARMQPIRPDDPFKVEGLRMLAVQQAEAGDVKGALETAELITAGTHGKALALVAVASAKARGGDRDGAAKLVGVIREHVPMAGVERGFGLMAVATAQAAAGQADEAIKTCKEIADAQWRDGALWGIAKEQAARGEIRPARQTAEAIEDAYHKSEALKEVVIALIRSKDLPGAVKATAEIGHDIGRCYALMEVAKAQFAAGQKTQAMQTLQEAQTLADRLENPPQMGSVREAALAHCAGVRATVGDADGALDWCAKQDNLYVRAMARIRVAEALVDTARK